MPKRTETPSPHQPPDIDPEQHASRLLIWYDRHRREMPWRTRRGERADPYRVWLSEIMLQQTTVAAVRGYFQRFLDRWPTLADLAAAPVEDVLAAWAGLGYYARARNLHRCAVVVANRFGGRFPDDESTLLTLPGIGPYTAAAIAAIAFDRPASAVDGNVERVIARLCAVQEPMPAAKPALRSLAAGLVPPRRAGDYAQAMMDLGAGICTPRSPACTLCPLNAGCAARRLGIAELLPRRSAKAERPTRRGLAFLVQRHDGAILLRRRPPRGLLGGMLEVPSSDWVAQGFEIDTALKAAPLVAHWTPIAGIVAHTFTHFHLELHVAHARISARTPQRTLSDAQWHRIDSLGELALPSVMRKVIDHALPLSARRR